MDQLLSMNPGNLLIYGLIFLGILYLAGRFIGENKGKVFLGLLGIAALVIFFRTPLQEAGWFPTELKGPFARAETSPPMVVPGQAVPEQPAPNLPSPAPNRKEDQFAPDSLPADVPMARSQSGFLVPFFSQKDPYFSKSVQAYGCGPMSAAMLLASQGKIDATKKTASGLANESEGKEWSVSSQGSNVRLIAQLINRQGLKVEAKSGVGLDQLKAEVSKAPVIVAMRVSCDMSKSPHLAVLLGMTEDKITYHDPYYQGEEGFERTCPLTDFEKTYNNQGKSIVRILDPQKTVFDPYSSAKSDCQDRVRQVLSQAQGKTPSFVLKALNQNEFDYCSIWALLAGDLDLILPNFEEEAIPRGKPTTGSETGHPFGKKLTTWLHFGRDFGPGEKDGKQDLGIYSTQHAFLIAKVYIPSASGDGKVPAGRVTEEQRLLGILLADTGYVVIAAGQDSSQVYMTVYGHGSNLSSSAATGTELQRGSFVDEMGMTGNTLGLHTHYGTTKNPRWSGSTDTGSTSLTIKKLDGWYDPFPEE